MISKIQTLRWRLMVLISLLVTGLWLLLAPWLLQSVQQEVQKTLDDRLEASARMVASLMRRQQISVSGTTSLESNSTPIATPEFPSSLACRVSNLQGEVVALSQGAPEEELETSKDGYENRIINGERWRIYTLTDRGLRIATADRLSTRDNLMASVLISTVLPLVFALSGTLVLVWFGIRRAFGPLRNLSANVARRDIKDLQPLMAEDVPAEVRPLVEEINRLLDRVSQGLSRERRFTGDAAHELRTPLTAIRTQLQVARLTEGPRAEHALTQAETAVNRLQETLEQLLLLARVEGNSAFTDTKEAMTDAATEAAISDVEVKAMAKGIRIQWSQEKAEAVAAPAVLVTAAIRNLLDNAIRHAPIGSTVIVHSKADSTGVSWTIVDEGPGAADDQLTLLTARFVRQGSSAGSGLGLSIVQAIAERFGGALELVNRQPHGLEARLSLPLTTEPMVNKSFEPPNS